MTKTKAQQPSCFLIGETSLLVQCAEHLIKQHIQILGIISADARVVTWANDQNIKTYHPTETFFDHLHQTSFDYLFSIINNTIIPDDILTLPRRYAINYHDGPLPKYAGLNATSWALLNQEKQHGVTWHVMTMHVDAGDILKQRQVEIAPDDTALTLNAKCFEAASFAFAELLAELVTKQEVLHSQNLDERTYFGLSKVLPQAGVIDWNQTPEAIAALVRALDFGAYPNPLGTAKLFLDPDYVIVQQIQVLSQTSPKSAGTLLDANESALIVATNGPDVALSGLATLTGHPLAPADIITTFDLTVGAPLPELPSDAARDLETKTASLAQAEQFWVDRLATLQPIRLPYAPIGLTTEPETKTVRVQLPKLAETADRLSTNPAELILAVFALYLARLHQSAHPHVGDAEMQWFDLGLQEVNDTLFATCHPYRIELDLQLPFTSHLQKIEVELSTIQQHQTFSRDVLARYPHLADLPKAGSTSDLLPITVSLVNSLDHLPVETTAFSLFIPTTTTTEISFRYQSAHFDTITIERIIAHISHLLQQIIAHPDFLLHEYSLVHTPEQHRLLVEWNDTATSDDRHHCIHHLIEAQVERTPDAVALIFEGQSLTYHQLNARANQLAHYLRTQGAEPGTIIGICMEYSIEMIVGLLGILKAGSAYTPLDPNYPAERLSTMISDAQPLLVLTQSHLQTRLPNKTQFIAVDQATDLLKAQPIENPSITVKLPTADDLIYVLFTSGSTGRPKGAGVYHRSFTNLVQWFISDLELTAQDSVLLISSLSFDLTQKNIYAPLLCGGTLHLVEMPIFDPHQIGRAIERYDISWVNCTPSTFYAVVDSTSTSLISLRYVVLGGEPITMPRLIDWLEQPEIEAKIVNTYGPTECTDICTFYVVEEPSRFINHPVPLGRPIDNIQLYILDQQLQLVPIGAVGELCIAGAGVGMGYINDPEMTEQKFRSPSFTADPVVQVRLYKTGDLARYQPDGTIEFLGRIDHQVKIRGFRVELGDIEAALNQHPNIHEAVVIAQETAMGGKRLVAYFVATDLPQKSQQFLHTLRQYLQQRLPDHMIPAIFVPLDQLPLTPNGKVNRQALPEPPRQITRVTHQAAPQSDTQKALAAIWQEELQLDQVGIDDNFFELGGHSLLLVNIQRQLADSELGHNLTVVDLFRYPTIRSLANYLDGTTSLEPTTQDSPIRPTMTTDTELAIVGLAGRFPGAPNVETFWQNLCEGRQSISFFSDDEMIAAGVDPELINQPNYVKAGGVLSNIEGFDADFFGLSAQEATVLDPQIRLFMECAWEALENAGCNPDTFTGEIGVYAGAGLNTYLSRLGDQSDKLIDATNFTNSVRAYQAMLANDKDFLATRVSYKLNLTGPSVTVQTACSTGLVAVHMARQALLSGDCDMALAGGVAIRVPHQAGYLYEEGMVFSPDGHCRAFDAEAQGMVLGNGVGVIALKRLADAVTDGDVIHAILKGSAINNDGAGKVGYTAPGVEGQVRVIRKAQASARVSPESITFVETHGTGTPLGDPIEVSALTEAFRASTNKTEFCALGAVKNNIGHLDIAAGTAGLIKAVLALKHKTIPLTPGYHTPNPRLKLEESPFYINTKLQPWSTSETPRRAGVSSFGIGGTNAHVVLEEAEEYTASNMRLPEGPYVLPLSAKTPEALLDLAKRYVDFLSPHHLPLANICYTAQFGRSHFDYRAAIVATTHVDIRQQLLDFVEGDGVQDIFIAPDTKDGAASNIARRYAQGDTIDWTGLYPDDTHLQKVELPTYPFQRQRYWVDPPQGDIQLKLQPTETDTWQDWLYTVEWEHQPQFGVTPDYLPPLKSLASESLKLHLSQSDVQHHQAAIQELEHLSVSYILNAFASKGLSLEAGQQWSTGQIIEQLGVQPQYQRLLVRLLQILVEDGILSRSGQSWCVEKTPETTESGPIIATLQSRFENIAGAEISLLTRCGEQLADVLSGEQNPLELLFPDGETNLVQQLYVEPQTKALVEQIRQVVDAAQQNLPPNRGLRILEIGGGTGSVTTALLPHLPADQTEYLFTDIGPYFVAKARQTFSHFDFVQYSTLDIEQSPLKQEYQPHQADIIIAANVLHAAKDLPQALTQVQELLAPNGWLILLEDTTPLRWADLTFGLTPGWWHFTDQRKTHPLLDVAQWQILLLEAGFEAIVSQPDDVALSQTILVAQAPSSPATDEAPTLIFTDKSDFGTRLADQLKAEGQSAIFVHAADTYRNIDTNIYEIRPEATEDYQTLFANIPPVNSVIYLWALDTKLALTTTHLPDVAQAQSQHVLSLVQTITQSLSAKQAADWPKLWLVTKGAVAGGEGEIDPAGLAQSPLWGLGKVVALEHSELWGGLIDIKTISEEEAKSVWDEIAGQASRTSHPIEDHLVFRNGQRYVARLREMERLEIGDRGIAQQSTQHITGPKFPAQSTYLITGGLGYLGLAFAEWLIEQGVTHLMLMSRSTLSSETEIKLKRLRDTVDKTGGELRVVQADVADAEQLAGVLTQCHELAPLRGVIHAAGIVVNQKIDQITSNELADVFQAKVHGTWHLHQLTQDLSLDHFICFSSAGAIWGAEGQAHYDAASYFPGALAQHRRNLGLPALTINWGLVAGERLAHTPYFQWLTKIGMHDMPVVDACRATGYLLVNSVAQAVVANMDWATFKPIYEWRGARALLTELGHDIDQTKDTSPLSEKPVADIENITTRLQQEITTLLQLPQPPSPTQGFFELGLDSLMTIELRNQLRNKLGIDLPLETLLKHSSVAALTTFIENTHPEVMAAMPLPPQSEEKAQVDDPVPAGWIEVTI